MRIYDSQSWEGVEEIVDVGVILYLLHLMYFLNLKHERSS